MAPAQIKATLWATTLLVALGANLLWVAATSADGWLATNLVFTALPMVPLIWLIVWYLWAAVQSKPTALKASVILFCVGFSGPAYSLLIVLLEPEQLPEIGSILVLFNVFSLAFLAVHWPIHRRLTARFAGSVQ